MFFSIPIVVGGPTGAGKSAVAIKLARAFSGEVINIDSVQLYRSCDIGSGKVLEHERDGIPHHLIDIRDPGVQVNVAEISALATELLRTLVSREKTPLVVAGTTMYVRSIFQGLAELPGRQVSIRKELEGLSSAELSDRLAKLDPRSAERIHPKDRMRLIRALEVFSITGRPLTDLFEVHKQSNPEIPALFIVLYWKRELLHERIFSRIQGMLDCGLMQETAVIREKFGSSAPALRSVGYLQCLAALESGIDPDLTLVTEQVAAATRQLAKRQITFWSNTPKSLGWKVLPEEGELLVSRSNVKRAAGKIAPVRVFSYNFIALKNAIQERLTLPFHKSELWQVDAEKLLSSM